MCLPHLIPSKWGVEAGLYAVRKRCAGARVLGMILLSGLACIRSHGTENEIEALVARAWRNNPSILAIEEQVAQALAAYDATEGFLDPQFLLGGGWSEDSFVAPLFAAREIRNGPEFHGVS